MGSRASKPARKLTGTLSKESGSKFNRSSNVNQLPPKDLKERYEKHISENLESNDNITPDESIANEAKQFDLKDNVKIDTALLQKKLKNRKSPQKSSAEKLPEGKDGFDPHVGSYDHDFVNSITHLGKQIVSQEASMENINSSLAVQQLKSRRQLYEIGQKEAGMENGIGRDHSKAEFERSMVHPRILSTILNDLNDPRVSKERVAQDFQLSSDFLKKLSNRFKVADTRVVIQDKLKEDEIGPSTEGPGKTLSNDHPVEEDTGEKISQDYLKKLSKRISLDD